MAIVSRYSILLAPIVWSVLASQALLRGIHIENCGYFGAYVSQPLINSIMLRDIIFSVWGIYSFYSTKYTREAYYQLHPVVAFLQHNRYTNKDYWRSNMKSSRHPTEKLGRQPKSSRKVSLKDIRLAPATAVKYIRGLGRNTKLVMALVLVLLAVGGLVGLVGGGGVANQLLANDSIEDTSEENNITATLRIVEGTVESKNQDGEWSDAKVGDEFGQGVDVRTVGAASRATIEFENSSVIRLDANSEIFLETTNTERIVIKQTDGHTYSRVTPVDGMSYIVKSTDAQYEAAGTAFVVITTGDEQAVEVYESTVIETATNQKVDQGNKLIVKSNVAPSDNGKIIKIDIERVKENSFITWNREIDAKNEAFKSKLGFLSDIESPAVTVGSPSDNDTILLEPTATEGAVEFTGKTEPNTTLTVLSKSSSNATAVKVTVSPDGSFTTPIIKAPLGSSVFEFIATDKTGNKTTQNVRLNFQKKSAPITAGGIVLKVAENGDKLKATWSYSGSFQSKDGVKIVYGETSSPTLAASTLFGYEVKATNVTIDISKLSDDTTYYFRACSYNEKSNSCSDYSNEVIYKLKIN